MNLKTLPLVLATLAPVFGPSLNSYAAATTLPLRSEAGSCLYNNATTQTIETNFGTTQVSLPFAQTTSYDFYSPPLAASASLLKNDKAGGTIAMKNTAATPANDFKVTGQMAYYDYDPINGTDTLIASTPASPKHDVNHNTTVHWPLPNADLPAAATIPAGHLLHMVVTITLMNGNPGSFGQFLYNGPDTPGPDITTTVAQLPQNRAMPWALNPLTGAPDATITTSSTYVDPGSLANTAQVPSIAGATYSWSVTNATITSGQGTSQIVWTAGSPSAVGIGVTVTKYCSSSSSASVRVKGAAGTIVSIAPTNACFSVSCSGTPGQLYLVQATTNLGAPVWTDLGTVTAGPDGLFSIIDTDSAKYPCRFYRTASQ